MLHVEIINNFYVFLILFYSLLNKNTSKSFKISDFSPTLN